MGTFLNEFLYMPESDLWLVTEIVATYVGQNAYLRLVRQVTCQVLKQSTSVVCVTESLMAE